MKALCFDQATATTGYAIGDENSSHRMDSNNRYYFGTIKAPKRDNFGERLKIIGESAIELIETHNPDVIGYEEPYFPIQGAGGGGPRKGFTPRAGFLPAEIAPDQGHDEERSRFNPETLKQLQMVKGIIIYEAARRGIPALGCTPSQWRVTLLGYGRKPKGAEDNFMKQAVRQRLRAMGFDVDSFDAADALGILYHTLHGKEAAQRKQGNLLDMAGGLL